jgi:SAM-dependent methyltransferase
MQPMGRDTLDDGRLFAAAAERNRGSILAELERVLPAAGLVLEIASGTGQHVVHFAQALPRLTWQPSDADPASRRSIEAWTDQAGLGNVRAPVALDVCRLPWPVAAADAVLCINMIHIAPWAATEALFGGAGAVLGQGGVLFLYGPYRRDGRHTAPSNQAFDDQLRARDPSWGVRDLEAVTALAVTSGFVLVESVAMPANNLSVVFRKADKAAAI